MSRFARRGLRAAAAAGLALGAAVGGCEAEIAVPRGQALVIIDTDMPIVGQLADNPAFSAVAAIDTVRIDVIEDDGKRYDFLDVVVPEKQDWPLSFGIAADGKSSTRIEVRAFKASFAHRGTLNGRDTLEPDPDLVIDRVVDIPLPSEGVQRVIIRLSGDCLGIGPSFDLTNPANTVTCIDAARPAARPGEGVEEADQTPQESAIGTWSPAIEVPCSGADMPDRVCIEGGYAILGDDRFEGYVDGITFRVGATPMHPIQMSPFYMDRTELTVGRYEALVGRGLVLDSRPLPYDASSDSDRFCTLGAGNPELPLNCISRTAAAAVCAHDGGQLPSEAQWEFAARGRGAGYSYPWGSSPPECCSAAVQLGGVDFCGAPGPRPVGSHTGADGCANFDVSRDGLVDMAGNLHEMTRDSVLSYADPCWDKPGVLRDPFCQSDDVQTFVERGGAWNVTLDVADAALRRTSLDAPYNSSGFRCVYPETRQ